MTFQFKSFAQKYNLLMLCFVIFAIWVLFAALTGGGFLSPRNLSNLFRQMSIIGIMSVGMAFVIITGNVDLSVGSVLGLLGAVSALSLRAGMGLPAVILLTLILGAVCGAFNGWWYAYRGVPAFIVTLAGLLIYRGVVLFITKGQTIPINNDVFNNIGSGSFPPEAGWIICLLFIVLYAFFALRRQKNQQGFQYSAKPLFGVGLKIALVSLCAAGFMALVNSYRGLPVPVFLLFVILGIAHYVSQNTVYGRTVYAIGGNMEAARFSGINIKKISLLVFLINGLIVGLASLVNTARLASAVPSTGVNSELDAIAACVIGGISLAGGVGSIIGALLGALIIASINNGMSYIGLDSAWQSSIKGLVLLLSVWADVSARK